MQCLAAIGAPARYVNWVKEYITSLSFTNAINGSIVGFFKGGRGLRQSDPLSPYLFVQGMEVTSRIISARVHNSNNFRFHPHGHDPQITHLCFANDLCCFLELT